MTYKYDNVYVNGFSSVVGPYEKKGPLSRGFDKSYDDLYMGEATWEQAEVKLLEDSIDIVLKKIKKEKKDIDLLISGDLLNQITSSVPTHDQRDFEFALKFGIPFLGVYSACASSIEGMIVGASMIDGKKINNCIAATSSHNMSSEKQFRNPTEYGAPKPKTATFTATGAASIYLSNKKGDIKVESSTIGKVVDMGQNDPLNMGAVMAAAAGETIYNHLKDLKREVDYYDLILTGDLGVYGKEILIDYMHTEYGIDISNNYDDLGTMLYDLKNQKQVMAGGSGPVCSALVNYSHILPLMQKKKLNRVLIVATGALFSPTFVFQHESINSIAHAVGLEVVE